MTRKRGMAPVVLPFLEKVAENRGYESAQDMIKTCLDDSRYTVLEFFDSINDDYDVPFTEGTFRSWMSRHRKKFELEPKKPSKQGLYKTLAKEDRMDMTATHHGFDSFTEALETKSPKELTKIFKMDYGYLKTLKRRWAEIKGERDE